MGDKKPDENIVRYSDAKLLDFEHTLNGLVDVTTEITNVNKGLVEAVSFMRDDMKEVKTGMEDVKEIVTAWKKGKLLAGIVNWVKKSLGWIAGLAVSLMAIYTAYKAGMK